VEPANANRTTIWPRRHGPLAALTATVAVLLGVAGVATPTHRPVPGVRPGMASPPGPGCARSPDPSGSATPSSTPSHPAPAPPAVRASLPPLPLPVGGGPTRAAHDRLEQLAQHVRALPEQPRCGRYTHVTLRIWAADDTITPPTLHRDIVLFEQQSWRAPDDSGRVSITRLTSQGPPTGSDDYPTGAMPDTIGGALSPDPAVLAGQLNTVEPWANGPQSAIRAMAGIYRTYLPAPAVRAALLVVAANATGLLDAGTATDALGRAGLTVTVDSDNNTTRDVLILDDTGIPLAYVMTQHDPVRGWQLVQYQLYQQHDRTAQAG